MLVKVGVTRLLRSRGMVALPSLFYSSKLAVCVLLRAITPMHGSMLIVDWTVAGTKARSSVCDVLLSRPLALCSALCSSVACCSVELGLARYAWRVRCAGGACAARVRREPLPLQPGWGSGVVWRLTTRTLRQGGCHLLNDGILASSFRRRRHISRAPLGAALPLSARPRPTPAATSTKPRRGGEMAKDGKPGGGGGCVFFVFLLLV